MMAKLSVAQIRQAALQIIAAHPGGIRYTPLVEAIESQWPETPKNTIHGSVWNLDTVFPDKVTKPSRGLFKLTSADENGPPDEIEPPPEIPPKFKEQEFYDAFAQWLKNDLDEVTTVKSLGGAAMKSKWGTPDVVGVYKALAQNLIKFPLEIVCAEIKVNPQYPVVAFGQPPGQNRSLPHATWVPWR